MDVYSDIDYSLFINDDRINISCDGYNITKKGEIIEFYAGLNSPMFKWKACNSSDNVMFKSLISFNQVIFKASIIVLMVLMIIIVFITAILTIFVDAGYSIGLLLGLIGGFFVFLSNNLYKKTYVTKKLQVLKHFIDLYKKKCA
jgi:hypothetical protein